jgi:hypothetical protein
MRRGSTERAGAATSEDNAASRILLQIGPKNLACPVVKLPRKRSFVLTTSVALVAFLVYAVVFGTSISQERYKNRWIERFSVYRGGGEIPTEWADLVGRRSFPSGEWVLAAMHHGMCSPGPEGSFDASVIVDSKGGIYYRDWSPCAPNVKRGVEFWQMEKDPPKNLEEFHRKHPEWQRVEPAS